MMPRFRATTLVYALIAVAFGAVHAHAGEAGAERPSKGLYRKTLRATGLVVAGPSRGSGWLVDRRRRLLVTNRHVVRQCDTVVVLFPDYRNGRVIAEVAHYRDKAERFRGTVLATDTLRDLAVVQLDTLPETVSALRLAADSPDPGDTVHSIGNPGVSGGLWVYTSGTVRQVYRKEVREAGRVTGLRVIETQSPVNPGDSGGPLVNDDGALVGVTAAFALNARLVSFCIDVSEVRAFLTEARPLTDPRSAADYRRRALHHQRQGRFGNALADLTRVIELDPRDAAAYLQRGAVYNRKGDPDRAIADLLHCLRLDPKSVAAYRERALAYSNKGEYEQALADYEDAIRLAPKDAANYNDRGVTRLRKGDAAGALADYGEALRLDARCLPARSNRAQLFLRQGKLDQAVADYTEILRQSPNDSGALNNRGFAHFRKAETKAAVADYESAIRANPRNAAAHQNLGEALLLGGEAGRAAAEFSEALRLSPNNAYLYLYRSRAYEKLGKESEARADREAAHRINPAVSLPAEGQPAKATATRKDK